MVKGDQAALRRAVTNLVVNAIRLAPEGSTITIATDSADGDATISVTDEGPGIARAMQESVFERFWRGDDSGKGLGLGLSIVRQVATRHGGSVDVRSALGEGSTFTIRLPMPVPVS
jgi:signal transduction histidine kinase